MQNKIKIEKKYIDEIEEEIIKKASNYLKKWNVINAMEYYSKLLKIEWWKYEYNTEFIMRISKYYLDYWKKDKALEFINKALETSWWNIDAIYFKWTILKLMWKKEEYEKNLNKLYKIKNWTEYIDIDSYLDKSRNLDFLDNTNVESDNYLELTDSLVKVIKI